MAELVNVLGVTLASWSSRKTRGFLRKTTTVVEHAHLDWTVDGDPLRTRVLGNDGSLLPDLITAMSVSLYDEDFGRDSLLALLPDSGGAEFKPWDVSCEDGRVALLYCPLCGDFGCGAVTAEVLVTDETVSWKDVAYQDTYTAFDPAVNGQFTLTFARTAYERTIHELLRTWSLIIRPESVRD